MKNKIKLVSVVFVLLAVGIVIYFYYFGRTTYKSKLCGYEFMYPQTWKIEDEYVKENGNFDKKICRVKVVSRKIASGGFNTFGQVSFDFRDEKDNEAFYQQQVDGKKKIYGAAENIEISGASGIKGYKSENLRGNGRQDFLGEVFLVNNNQGVLIIDANLLDVNTGQYKQQIDSIISSFQLLK